MFFTVGGCSQYAFGGIWWVGGRWSVIAGLVVGWFWVSCLVSIRDNRFFTYLVVFTWLALVSRWVVWWVFRCCTGGSWVGGPLIFTCWAGWVVLLIFTFDVVFTIVVVFTYEVVFTDRAAVWLLMSAQLFQAGPVVAGFTPSATSSVMAVAVS